MLQETLPEASVQECERPAPAPRAERQKISGRSIGKISFGEAKSFKGRGATLNLNGRFDIEKLSPFDDGWDTIEQESARPVTRIFPDRARSVISSNDSPDINFSLSINPYRGCEHGCSYCFARPSHAYLGLSPGLDFETKIFAKKDAVECLRRELAKKSYRPSPIALGINTDGWQPIERKLGHTRALLEVLSEHNHPVSVVTKSALIERDLDLLAPMAEKHLASAAVSITTLDPELSRRLEPRAASPARRLQTVAALAQAGIQTTVLVAPIIPALNDSEIESLLEGARDAGATGAGYMLLRLPHELREIFPAWLREHVPERAEHILNLLRQMRGGDLYDARFGVRGRGQGPLADMLAARFKLARKKFGLDRKERRYQLRTDLFSVPQGPGSQLNLI